MLQPLVVSYIPSLQSSATPAEMQELHILTNPLLHICRWITNLVAFLFLFSTLEKFQVSRNSYYCNRFSSI